MKAYCLYFIPKLQHYSKFIYDDFRKTQKNKLSLHKLKH